MSADKRLPGIEPTWYPPVPSECRCAAIMAADPSRHFMGCPERARHPEVNGPPVPFGDKGEDERLGFPLQVDILLCDANCGACNRPMQKGEPLFGYRLGTINEFGYRDGDGFHGNRCMECALGAFARLRARILSGEFGQ